MHSRIIGTKATGVGAAAVAAALSAYLLVVRPEVRKWSASDEEERWPLPGDELVPDAKWQGTHGVTIEAPALKSGPGCHRWAPGGELAGTATTASTTGCAERG